MTFAISGKFDMLKWFT